MKIKLLGKNVVINLTNNDFLAAGGEGKIYAKQGVVYKICDPGKMIPQGKIQELQMINDKNVILPEDIILDSKDNIIGYTMKYLDNTYLLGQLFAKAFRLRNNITPEMMLDLVRTMQKRIELIHSKKILLVDINELNFLVNNQFKDIYFIDVNSYQTPHYPATAIMDSIRDRHAKQLSELSDWFSFAILSFQMLVGIHPYKGRHDHLKTLDDRMNANVSIFNDQVSYPQGACQSFDVVPKNYLQWYKAIFEEGKRVPPPKDIQDFVIQVLVKHISGSNNFDIKELFDFKDVILNHFQFAGKEVVVTNTSIFLNRKKITQAKHDPFAKVCFTPTFQPISVNIYNGKLHLINLNNGDILDCDFNAQRCWVYQNRLYILNNAQILEIEFIELGNNIVVGCKQLTGVVEQTTKIFDGVVVQTLFDALYVSIFPEKGTCRQFALRNLDGLKIIDAKYEDQLLMIITIDPSGIYHRHIYWFDNDWKFQTFAYHNVTNVGINFTILDNGICVVINDEEHVEVFNKKNPLNYKSINDPAIEGDMRLLNNGIQALFIRGTKLYSLTMKKP